MVSDNAFRSATAGTLKGGIGDFHGPFHGLSGHHQLRQKELAALKAITHLGDALLAIDVYALGDGQPLAGFNSQPRWSAYLAQMTGRLTETLANCGLPAAGGYYLIDLDAPQSLLVVPGRNLQWSLLFDATRAPLGLVLNVVLPELRAAFGEA